MKQLFFSHTWKTDKLGRNNHERVKKLVEGIQKIGWKTWFDEDDMVGNIDASMADGIDRAQCIIVCLTEEYCIKVNHTARNPRVRDNCHKEWNYAHNRGKLMIPIIMEPYMLDPSKWPAGVVPLHLGTTLYLDASNDNIIDHCIFELHKTLIYYGLYPNEIYGKILREQLSFFRKSLNRANIVSKLSSYRRFRKPKNLLVQVRI